jgi:geranylgeranylglycerol-phosphate geranylgeranyltransferase
MFGSIKDHIMIGGPNAIAGWGLLFLLVLQGGFAGGNLRPEVDLDFFLALLVAAALTGNGVYALNAVYDLDADMINKPNRPLPSRRMTKEHALKYAYSLLALGLVVCTFASLYSKNYLIILLWSIFTLLGVAYSKPPLKLKAHHIFGNLCFGTFAGLTFLIGIMIVPSSISVSIGIFILFTIIFVAGLVTMKDFQDVEGDKKNGDITLPAKVGRGKAAIISIIMMAPYVARIPLVPYGVMAQPPILDWFLRNFLLLIIIGSFVVYIALDRIGRGHIISDAYSRVLYFYVIFFTTYNFFILPSPGMTSSAFFPSTLLPLVYASAPFIALAIYVTMAIVVTSRSWKMGHDILRPG